MLNITIIAGTTRHGSQTGKVADFVEKTLSESLVEKASTQLVDVSDLDLSGGEDGDLEDRNKDFIDTIEKSDGFIIVSPEYNHSFPGSLKSALDICYDEYNNKAVGFVGVSSGTVGGARMIEHLVSVVKTLGLKCVKKDVLVGPVKEMFDEEGNVQDEKLKEKIESLGEEVVKLSEALKTLRS